MALACPDRDGFSFSGFDTACEFSLQYLSIVHGRAREPDPGRVLRIRWGGRVAQLMPYCTDLKPSPASRSASASAVIVPVHRWVEMTGLHPVYSDLGSLPTTCILIQDIIAQ